MQFEDCYRIDGEEVQCNIILGESLLVTGFRMEGSQLLLTFGNVTPEKRKHFCNLKCRSSTSKDLKCGGLK